MVEIKQPDVLNKFSRFPKHLEEKTTILRADVNSILELLQRVATGDVPDVSGVHVASNFKVDVCRVVKIGASCTSEMSATMTHHPQHRNSPI